MIFFSGINLFICIFFIVLYYVVPKKARWIVLAVASVSMVVIVNSLKSSVYALLSVLLIYGCALGIEKATGVLKNLLFGLGLIFALSSMALLKTFSGFIHIQYYFLAPLGLSYYTFAMTGYLIDIKREMYPAQRNPLKFVLFALFFPTLLSGPIMNYSSMQDNLYTGHELNVQKIIFGVQKIIWGLFKKMVISDRVGVLVNLVFDNYEAYPGYYILLAILLFPLQLYTDFSGCIDMIMGLAEMFGVDLPENFSLPFLSESVAEFWRKWHITLGQWLRDYVFYSILRSSLAKKITKILKKRMKNKKAMQIVTWLALLITWYCIGLWHSGTWSSIFGVGLFFGGIIVISEMTEHIRNEIVSKLHINTACFSYRCFRIVRTYLLFAVGNSFFRQRRGLADGFLMWGNMFKVNNPWIFVDGSLLNAGLDHAEWFALAVSVIILILAGIAKAKLNSSLRLWIYNQNVLFSYLVWITIIVLCVLWGWYGEGYTTQAFIYQQF